MRDDVIPAGFPVGCGDSASDNARDNARSSDGGEGPPLVLLHCSGADRQIWSRVMDAWAGMDALPPRRILRPELFGCGQTGRWPFDSAVTLDDVADLVCRAIGAVETPFDLVGHSFGGAVALHLARRDPARIRTLTLIEPTCFFLLQETGRDAARLLDEVTTVAQMILDGAAAETAEGRQQGMGAFVDYWNGAGKWQALPDAMRQAMAGMVDAVAQDFRALYAEPTRLDDLRDLQLPTLIVNGLRSPQPVQHIAALLEHALPQAERCTLLGAGHMIPLSHAAQLAGLIAVKQLGGPPDVASAAATRQAANRYAATAGA